MGNRPKYAQRRVRRMSFAKRFMRGAAVVATMALSASMFVAATAAASSGGGSDDPTPYTVSADGLTLPSGDVFPDGGHVNIRYTKDGGPEQGASIHFESLNWPDDDPRKFYIGKSFIPWSALGLSGDFCITWVQVSMYNEHFGEGGQAPVCNTTPPPPPPSDECAGVYEANCLVSPPDFNPGTCQAPGSMVADDTDVYTWSVSGPLSARLYTAVPRDGKTLTGQTVFGPYDLRQVDWKSEDCQPTFEVKQQCAYVKITYHNNSKWDRWPDYSFTGDTKEPTDFGSGPTWNTVKVAPGETKVIFERQFDEDYADGGPIEVWYQDILGAERDIDTSLVTLTVVTDCEANEVSPVLPEVIPQVCTPPNGDLTGGSIELPEGPEGLKYTVFQDGVEVADLANLEPGDYQVVATVVEEHRVISGSDVWSPSDDGQSATATVTVDAADDCRVERPPVPPVEEGEWTDVSSPTCGDTQVTQTRWVREYADPVWDDANQVWVEDEVGTVTEETRVRDLTPEELADLEEECTELPPPPKKPEGPKDKVKAADVTFTDPTLVCEDGDWTKGNPGKVTIPKSDGVVYLIKNREGKYVEIEAGTIGVDLEKVSVIAKSTDEDVKLVGKAEWSHTFKPVKQSGGDCELATTGGDFAQAVGLAALLSLTGIGAVVLARRRNRAEV